MPTYEYACRECGEHLEVVQSFKDDPLTTCLGCGGDLRKVFSATGIIFKGSGYYVTDTRKKSTAESAGNAKSSSSKASADTSSSPDSSSSSSEAKSA
jgi:putative FmdB family regulatory protein